MIAPFGFILGTMMLLAAAGPGRAEDTGPTQIEIHLTSGLRSAVVDVNGAALLNFGPATPLPAERGRVRFGRLSSGQMVGSQWRLWCHIGDKHYVENLQTTWNPLRTDGIKAEPDRVTIRAQFGSSLTELIPVFMEVTYVLDARGVWMYGKLSTQVPVKIEQLEYIIPFTFEGDPHCEEGRMFMASGWSMEFRDTVKQEKICPGYGSEKYYTSAPPLDRRAMGWSWLGHGLWFIFPDSGATRSRFQKEIGVYSHNDPKNPQSDFHYIAFQPESGHLYHGCPWFTLPKNPFGEQEPLDLTRRQSLWTLEPGVEKYYGPYLLSMTTPSNPGSTSQPGSDEDEAGYQQVCARGEELRKDWPPAWFPLRPRTIRFNLDAPPLSANRHYCLVLYSNLYWFSAQTRQSGPLTINVLTDQPFRGLLIATDDRLGIFKVVHKLFDGQAASLQTRAPYFLSLTGQSGP